MQSSLPTMSKMKIIDMTGREQKIHHGYESLSKLGGGQTTESVIVNFELSELTKNLNTLVEMTEAKIIQAEKK